MQAILRKYFREEIDSEEIVTLPDDYDGNPYGDKVPFSMASNWTLQVLDEDSEHLNEK
jgi:hypothetical protein